MHRVSWSSLLLGIAIGVLGSVGALLLITMPEAPVADVAPLSTDGAEPPPMDLGSAPAAVVAKAPTPEGDGREMPRLVGWLSERLQEAYTKEALPEIIGADAGAEAADQVFDYILEDYDTDTIEDLLADFLESETAVRLQDGVALRSTLDCGTPPCVIRIDLAGVDGQSVPDCGGARAGVVQGLNDALQPGSVTTESWDQGGCGMKVVALSAQGTGRQDEINAGIEGFLENYFSEAKTRLDAMESPP